MPNKKNHWTLPRDDGAPQGGGRQSKREGAEAFLQARNGQIRERNTYGDDPYPTKG
jgi:hypothetical protein